MRTACVHDIENKSKLIMSIVYLETLNIEWGQIDPKHNRRVKNTFPGVHLFLGWSYEVRKKTLKKMFENEVQYYCLFNTNIDITDKGNRTKDSHMLDFPFEVQIANRHNHNLSVADALCHQDVGEKVKSILNWPQPHFCSGM